MGHTEVAGMRGKSQKSSLQSSAVECGVFSLYGRQVGLSELAARQGSCGAYVDSCFTAEALVGTARWEKLRHELRAEQAAGGERVVVRFGGGAAEAVATWKVTVVVGRVDAVLTVVVVRGHLPLLLGESAMAKLELVVDGPKRAVVQRGEVLSRWHAGAMPMVEVRQKEAVALVGVPEKVESVPVVRAFAEPAGSAGSGGEGVGSEAELAVRETAEPKGSGRGGVSDAERWKSEWRSPKKTFRREPVHGQQVLARGEDVSKRARGFAVLEEADESGAESDVFTIGEASSDAPEEVGAEEPIGRNKDGVQRQQRLSEPMKKKRQRSRRWKGRVPKVFQLSDSQLKRIHNSSHASRSRMEKFLLATLEKEELESSGAEVTKLKDRIKRVISECPTCQRLAPRLGKPVSAVTNLEGEFLSRGWLDCFALDKREKFYACAIVDEASADVSLAMIEGPPNGRSVWLAYFTAWAARKGHFVELVTDGGGENRGAFERDCEAAGIARVLTPAEASESHGRVERVIRTARWSLDRLREDERTAEWSASEWLLALAATENALRNEVTTAGYSSSIRTTGRSSTVHRTLLDDTAVTGACDAWSLEVQERAMAAYRRTVCDRQLRQILASQAKPSELAVYQRGDLVEYYREDPGARRGIGRVRWRWHGPAKLGEWVPSSSSGLTSGHYTVHHGSRMLRVHREHLRRAGAASGAGVVQAKRGGEVVQGSAAEETRGGVADADEPSRVEEPRGGVADADRGAEQAGKLRAAYKCSVCGMPKAGHVCAGPAVERAVESDADPSSAAPNEDPSSAAPKEAAGAAAGDGAVDAALAAFAYADSDESWELSEDEFDKWAAEFSMERRQKAFALLAGLRSDRAVVISTIDGLFVGDEEQCFFSGAMDVYQYTWEDVPDDEKHKARRRALADYDNTDSWERGSELPWSELTRLGKVKLTCREVAKAKMDGGVLKGRLRWTPRGFQQRGLTKKDTEAPTAAKTTHRVCDVFGKSKDWVPFVADASEAFFHSVPFDDVGDELQEELWIETPYFDDGAMSQVGQEARARGEKVGRRLLREVPGTKRAPRSWWETITRYLISDCGCVQSKVDPCLLWIPISDGSFDPDGCPWNGYVALHVDDFKGRATRSVVHWLDEKLNEKFNVRFRVIEVGEDYEYTGERYTEHAEYTEMDQWQYADLKLAEVELDKGRWRQREDSATPEEKLAFQSKRGAASWMTGRTRIDQQYETSYASSCEKRLKVKDILRLNKTIRVMKDSRWRYKIRMPKLRGKLKVVGIVDAGEGEHRKSTPNDEPGNDVDWEHAQAGRLIGLMEDAPVGTPGAFAAVSGRSGKCKRVTHSSFDAECVSAIECVDECIAISMILQEAQSGVRPSRIERAEMAMEGAPWEDVGAAPIEIHTDAKSVVDRTESKRIEQSMAKRRKMDIADLQELRRLGILRRMFHIAGPWNPIDALTKPKQLTKQTMARLVELLTSGYYEPITC